MAGKLEIRRKIRSIKSTRQITRAMELVAASKMKRAIANTTALRPFATHALSLLLLLSETEITEERASRVVEGEASQKALVILITSDRGLCGGFNTLLFKHLLEAEKREIALNPDRTFDYIALGKKGQDFLSRTGRTIVGSYPGLTNNARFDEVLPIAKTAINGFHEGQYDRVILSYQLFKSALVQKPIFTQLLPFSKRIFEETLAEQWEGIDKELDTKTEFVFEPSKEFILKNLLPRLTEMQIYQAVLEATASEHSSRMVAMKNATNNASDLIDTLTLIYNQARQAGITQEIAEISAGRIALGF